MERISYFDPDKYVEYFGESEQGFYQDTWKYPRREGLLVGGKFDGYCNIQETGQVHADAGLYVVDGGCNIFSIRDDAEGSADYDPYLMALQAQVSKTDFKSLRHFFDPESEKAIQQGYIARIDIARPSILFFPGVGFAMGADEKIQTMVGFDGGIYSYHSNRELSLSTNPEYGEVLFERDGKVIYEQTKPSMVHTTQTVRNKQLLKFVFGLEYDPHRLSRVPSLLHSAPINNNWYPQLREIINPYLRAEIIRK